METLAPAPANAETTTFVEPPDTDVDGSETNGDGSAPSAPEAGTPAKVKDPVQERFDKLTRDKYDALREGDRKGYLLEQRDRELADLRTKLEARENTQAAPATGFPTLEQYGFDEAKYQAAVIAHISDLAKMQGKTAAAEALKEERERQQSEKAGQSWAQREAELIKSKPDYVDKVQNATTLPISKDLQGVLKGHSQGPQIALYLVDNSDAASAIMRLPLAEQLIEVGRIAGKMEAAKVPPKPAVSQAPPPVNKVDTTESSADKAPEDMIGSTPTQFAKWRKKYMK